jgi:hypothetical protein
LGFWGWLDHPQGPGSHPLRPVWGWLWPPPTAGMGWLQAHGGGLATPKGPKKKKKKREWVWAFGGGRTTFKGLGLASATPYSVTLQSHIRKKREKAHIEWVIYKESHEC